jgi:uncharacterized membrane protein YkvA (DUF1232 family)
VLELVPGEFMFHNPRMSDAGTPRIAPSPSQRRWAWLGIAVSVIYLLNPDGGLFELIPDFVPVVGNLDEVGATLLFLKCLSTLRKASRSASGPSK